MIHHHNHEEHTHHGHYHKQYWGDITSDYDFCESNYEITIYIAEFFSCFSSIPIMLYGLYFLQHAIKYSLGWRIKLSCIGVAVIGLGSFIFHGTLTRGGQMLDELPMLWSSLFFLFTALTIEDKPESPRIFKLGFILSLCGIISTSIYFAGGFIFFIASYILTVASVIAVTIKHIHQVNTYPLMTKFAYMATGLYAGGFFFFWIPEQYYCGNQLLIERTVSSLNDLPIPLHAWFHFTSALGPYYWLAFVAYGHIVAMKKEEPHVTYPRCWKSLWLALPVVQPKLGTKFD